jgi:molybdopterin-guanine dinucleotide biosynthesis protein A
MNANYLADLFARTQIGCGIVGNKDDYYEPLAAVYPREAGMVVGKFAESGGSALQPLIASLVEKQLMVTVRISRGEREFFQSINTPDEFDKCKRQLIGAGTVNVGGGDQNRTGE